MRLISIIQILIELAKILEAHYLPKDVKLNVI
jgi:hypothetical protein